jgi:hypothetical protein
MSLRGFICYCPELRLYRYKVTDDSKPELERDTDYKFDEDELEDAITTHLVNENKTEAEFMTQLTGLARVSPHKIIYIDQNKEEIRAVDPAEFFKEHDEAKATGKL